MDNQDMSTSSPCPMAGITEMLYNLTDRLQSPGSTLSNDSYRQPEDGYDDIMAVAFFINKYYLWVILAIGFPGNLATIITIFRMRSLGSFTLYVVLLAVMDNLAIVVKTLIYQLLENRVNIGTSGCKILNFLANCFVTYANWILVLMAIERLVAVKYPLKIQKYLGCKKSTLAVCIVGVTITGAYAPILWVTFYNDNTHTCDMERDSPELLFTLYWMNVCLFVFIPFIVLALCNLIISRIIRQSFRLRNALRNIHSVTLKRKPSSYDVSIQRQILLMLFTSTLVFVLFLFPNCAFHVADIYWKVEPVTREYAIKYLLGQIAFVLCDSTHAVNFYLYFLSARKFRNNFMRMSTCATASPRPTSI